MNFNNLNQSVFSNMESQSDRHISTLHCILSAMGVRLEIIAQFLDGEFVINQFDPISSKKLKEIWINKFGLLINIFYSKVYTA